MTSAYVSAKQTKELLACSAPNLRARLAAADMLNVEQAARYAHTDVATMRRWIAAGRAIALEMCRDGYRLPWWQFDPGIWGAIPRLAEALDTTQGWPLMNFLESPCAGLGGRIPRQAIQQGDLQAVLQAALAESH